MSFPRYESYKDSGVEWLGEVPSSWRTNKIKFSTYVKGRVGWHGLNSNEFSDVGVHLVTGTDFENGFVNWDRCYRISEQRYIEDPYIQLKENDLLITKDGTIGKLARVKGLPGQASLNSGIFLVRAKDESYLEDFLYWVLQSSLFNNFMDLHKVGSTIQHLYQEVFNQFAFPIPSKSEQHLICVFLDRETAKIDALIAEQQRLIELLKEKRQAVISHAVTKGLNPDAPMKDSGIEWLGDVPEHWEICALKRIASLKSGNTINSDSIEEVGEFPVFGGNGLRGYTSSYTHEGTYALIGRQGALCGNINYSYGKFWASEHAVVVLPLDVVETRWLGELLRAMNLNQYSISAAQPGLSVEIVGNLRIPFPPSIEQTFIAAFLDSETAKLDTLTTEAQRAIELLKERRTALISAAVTGKIDVRTFAN